MDPLGLKTMPVVFCTFSFNPEAWEDVITQPGYLVDADGERWIIVFNFAHGRTWQIVDAELERAATGPFQTFREAARALRARNSLRAARERQKAQHGSGSGIPGQSVKVEFTVHSPMIGQAGIVLFPDPNEADLSSEGASWTAADDVGSAHAERLHFEPELAYIVPVGPSWIAYRAMAGFGPSLWWEAFDLSLGVSLWEGAVLDELIWIAPLARVMRQSFAETADRTQRYRTALALELADTAQTVDEYLAAGQLLPAASVYQRIVPTLFPDMGGRRIRKSTGPRPGGRTY